MSEQSQPEKKPLTNEEVNELLLSDYAVEEAASDRNEVGDRLNDSELAKIRERFAHGVASLVQDIFSKKCDPLDATSFFSEILEEYEVKSDTQYKSAGSSEVPQLSNKEFKASVHQMNKDFLTVVIPRDWNDEPLYVSLFDDGWEVCQAKNHPLGNIAKSNWTDEKTEELEHLTEGGGIGGGNKSHTHPARGVGVGIHGHPPVFLNPHKG